MAGASLPSDAELVLDSLAGRRGAFEELARRWTPRVLAVCHARTDRRAAEDLAQETILRGFSALRSLAAPEKFGAWICGIATRVCLDWLKARARTQVPFSDLGFGDANDVEAIAPSSPGPSEEAVEEAEAILREVEGLDEAERTVVLLFYYDELTYADIAEILGISPATVNARLSRARATLRHRLSRLRR